MKDIDKEIAQEKRDKELVVVSLKSPRKDLENLKKRIVHNKTTFSIVGRKLFSDYAKGKR